jgi:hypothetical protein
MPPGGREGVMEAIDGDQGQFAAISGWAISSSVR